MNYWQTYGIIAYGILLDPVKYVMAGRETAAAAAESHGGRGGGHQGGAGQGGGRRGRAEEQQGQDWILS